MRKKIVVITGSSRGIGLGLSEAFINKGCSVVVSGRTFDSTQDAFQKLSSKYPGEQVYPFPCDVREVQQVQSLWEAAVGHYGKVDIWINNAGLSGPVKLLWQHDPGTIEQVIQTNLIGVVHGSRVALRGMLEQGFGAIYNMEGMGSDGRMHEGLTLYGATKYSLKYLNDALAREVGDKPVIIGALRPGMVATDLITEQYKGKPQEWQKAKKIFNLIADRVDVVAPWLVDKVLANQKNGVRFNYFSGRKMLWRTITMPFNRRDIFGDLG